MRITMFMIFLLPNLVMGYDWEALETLLNDYCEDHQCETEVQKHHFDTIVNQYHYGCILFSEHTSLKSIPQLSFSTLKGETVYIVSHQDSSSNYFSTIKHAKALLNDLLHAGFSDISIAEPSTDIEDFTYPYSNYCGNNILLWRDNQWQSALADSSQLTSGKISLLVFTPGRKP